MANNIKQELRTFLDRKVAEYNQPSFIIDDPVCIPHRFTQKQDIEIAGFFTAIFSWGNRKTIIGKTQELMQLMDQAPYQFVRSHTDTDLKKLLGFKHRTFNATDLLYFVAFFQHHYANYDSLEDAFLLPWENRKGPTSGSGDSRNAAGAYDPASALSAFHHYFFSLEDAPPRTRKHIASPEKHSSCKRINMFLRWMVRKDLRGVDFGLWSRIPASRLICPLDVHVARVAKRFGLLTRERSDWQAAVELTESLSLLDKEDPAKYDFALFGLGVMENF
ncbi:MAG TPA: TIGR02757 family protein [Puia sp.]